MYVCNGCGANHRCKAYTGEKLEVRINGWVYPCAAFKRDDRFRLGNVFQGSTLADCQKAAQEHKLLQALAVITGAKPFNTEAELMQAFDMARGAQQERPVDDGVPVKTWEPKKPTEHVMICTERGL